MSCCSVGQVDVMDVSGTARLACSAKTCQHPAIEVTKVANLPVRMRVTSRVGIYTRQIKTEET